jgi:NTE family protein
MPEQGRPPVGLVLAGGGARGAYEIGALAELLPALPEHEEPRVIVGTSVGALNAAFLAMTATVEVGRRMEAAEALWRGIHYRDVLKPLWQSGARGAATYVRELFGDPESHLYALLDPAPLANTLARLVAFDRVEGEPPAGTELAPPPGLDSVAVVATSAATEQSVVFHQGGVTPPADVGRGIEYVAVALGPEHVLASAAIPVAFPAVEVSGPGAGWYYDGGTRLNTPIKPALELGAERMIVIALNSLARRPGSRTDRRPDVFDGAGQLIQALLVDPLVNDVHTLAMVNETVRDGGPGAEERKVVPYILVAPEDPDEIGATASRVYRENQDELPGDLELLGRLLDAGAGPMHGELLSYLFFAPQMADALIELGRRDARRWIEGGHDAGLWQVGQLDS